MNTETKQALQALLPAIKSLYASLERAQMTGTPAPGAGKMAARTYTVLHSKVAALLPDDIYITEALKLDTTDEDSDEALFAQVNLAASQLQHYLKSQVVEDEPWMRPDDLRELKNLGRDLQDQILNQTRNALRRAMSGLEDHIPPPPTPPAHPEPPVKRGSIPIDITDDEDDR